MKWYKGSVSVETACGSGTGSSDSSTTSVRIEQDGIEKNRIEPCREKAGDGI